MNYKLVKNTEWQEVEINGEIVQLPSNWQTPKIEDTIELNMGSTPKKELDNYSGNLPWITITNLNKKFISQYTANIKRSKNIRVFPKGTLIGSFKMSVGRFGFTTEDSAINEAIIGIKENGTKNNLNYLYYCLPKIFLKNAEKNGQGLLLLNQEKIKNLHYPCPTTYEQDLISSVLSKQEGIISNIQKLIEKNEIIFKELSEQLLSGELRLQDSNGKISVYKNPEDNWKEVEINGEIKNIPKDWSVTTFPEKLIFKNGTAFKKEFIGNVGKPIIKIQHLSNKDAKVEYYSLDENKLVKIKKGDILFAWSGTIDVFEYSGHDAYLNQHIFRVDYKYENIPYFTYLLKKEIKKMNTNGLTMQHITLKELNVHQFFYSKNVEEQKLISNMIVNDEYKMKNLRNLLTKEKAKFEWLLDNLLSGTYLVKEV